jgi:hypothetical protein
MCHLDFGVERRITLEYERRITMDIIMRLNDKSKIEELKK